MAINNTTQNFRHYHHRQVEPFLIDIASRYSLKTKTDWEQLSSPSSKSTTTSLLLHHLSGGWSLKYRQHEDLSSLFSSFHPSIFLKPPTYKPSMGPSLLLAMGRELGLSTHEDWKKISTRDVIQCGGRPTIRHFNDSLLPLLEETLPEMKTYKLKRFPKNHWNMIDNQRFFLDWICHEKNPLKEKIKKQRDWKLLVLNPELVELLGIGSLLVKYNGSVFQMLKSVYGEFLWNPLEERRVVSGRLWESELDVVVQRLMGVYWIKRKEDWYRLSDGQVGGVSLRRVGKSRVTEGLRRRFPEENWNLGLLSLRNKRAQQRWLFLMLCRIFPGEEVVEEFVHAGLLRKSGAPVVFDVYVGEGRLNMGFEYQGEHHYRDLIGAGCGCLELQLDRDEEKRRLSEENGILLLEVPYWWDLTEKGLKEIIRVGRKKTR